MDALSTDRSDQRVLPPRIVFASRRILSEYYGAVKTGNGTSGIRDIAEALGTSIGTVDRALHNRGGISPQTRERVLRMAEQLGYRPNIAARNLKLNRRLRIAAVLPREIAAFFDPLRGGIRAAADRAIGLQVELDMYEYAAVNRGELEAIENAAALKYDGILFTPGNPRKLHSVIRNIVRQGTAMVAVASDAPNSERTGSVALDAYTSGALAAELLSHKLPKQSRVVNITGDLDTLDHAEKLRGFAAGLATFAPHLHLLPAIEAHDSADDAYAQSVELLRSDVRPDALYISTANSLPVLRALEEEDLFGCVQVITTDLFDDLIPLLESGKIFATLHQRPYEQGKLAFEVLLRALLDRKKSAGVHRLAPDLVFRSNLGLFADRLRAAQLYPESVA